MEINKDEIKIILATVDDAEVVSLLISELAQFEHLETKNHSTPKSVAKALGEGTISAAVAYKGSLPVGLAVFYEIYSTFAASKSMYLEDLFVMPSCRGNKIGLRLMKFLAKIAQEKKHSRMEWSTLVWNSDTIDFYEYLDAKPSDEWLTYRLYNKWIDKLAANEEV